MSCRSPGSTFHRGLLITALVLAGLAGRARAAPPAREFRVLESIPLPGDGGWDLATVDATARRLYVSHATKVDVVDVDSGVPAGTIGPFQGVHGVAVVPGSGHGFVSDGKASQVAVFDLKTLEVTDRIPVGRNPDVILYDPASRHVFAFNAGGSSVSVIDAESLKVVNSVELGGAPEFGVADGTGHVFVNLEDKGQVLRLDSRKGEVTGRWSVAPGEAPTSLSMDAKHNRLFIGCRNRKMVVLDAGNGKVVQVVPIGERVDGSVFDPESGVVFHSCGDGTLSVVHEDTPDAYREVQVVATRAGSRTMAWDPKKSRAFLPSADFGPVPAATAENPRPRPPILPGTFKILVIGR